MRALPWYLRQSPALFCVVAAVKFLEAFFALRGAQVWDQSHTASADAQLLVGMRVLDSVIYALGWLGSAAIAKLLVTVFDKVGSSHA